jgi:3-oxoacyl-[acyl-carrier protein] reductase
MEDRGSGAIVALGSVYGVMGCDIMPEYGAAKGGVIAFAKGLAREVLPAGVRVNVVAPGAVRTPMLEEGLDERLAAMGRPGMLGGDWTTPDVVARTILHLASEDAAYTTGQVVSPNGGVLI